MALAVPYGLSPSKVESFKSCALAFRFSAIDRLPEPPSPWATKGTLVHRALELLFEEPPRARTLEAALTALDRAYTEMGTDPDLVDLHLDDEQAQQLLDEAEALVRQYFRLEDPTRVHPIGLELRLSAEVGGTTMRGVIDRLDLDADGELVVTDYKTGKPPRVTHEQGRLSGVNFYALLCERVLGRRPARVQLLYLSEPLAIVATPSDQKMSFLDKKVGAIWTAVERACRTEDFRPNRGPLCDFCAFKAYCPAFGGDPALAGQHELDVRALPEPVLL
jgi:putative RecB family exonuclease